MNRTRRTLSMILAVFVLAALIAPAVLAGGVIGITTHDSFEPKDAPKPTLAPWKLKDGSNDKIVCIDKAPHIQHGTCAFLFRGSAGEKAMLVQQAYNIDQMNAMLQSVAGFATVRFSYYSDSAASVLDARVLVTYIMPGSSTPQVAKDNVRITGKSNDNGPIGWVERSLETPVLVPQYATVLSAKVQFKNLSKAGKLYIDEVYGLYQAGD